MTGTNRGYAFVTFTTREAAACAVKEVTMFLQYVYVAQICFMYYSFIFQY